MADCEMECICRGNGPPTDGPSGMRRQRAGSVSRDRSHPLASGETGRRILRTHVTRSLICLPHLARPALPHLLASSRDSRQVGSRRADPGLASPSDIAPPRPREAAAESSTRPGSALPQIRRLLACLQDRTLTQILSATIRERASLGDVSRYVKHDGAADTCHHGREWERVWRNGCS